MNEYTIVKLVIALGIGLAVGGGLMILGIAKWGRALLVGERGEQGDRGSPGVQGIQGKGDCPFAGDHPTLQAFMGESLADRKDMRGFLEDINDQVRAGNNNITAMKTKLDLIWQGAKVRWNGSLPREGD